MWGKYYSTLVFPFFCFFFSVNYYTNLASANIECMKTRCNHKDAPIIEYPFRLQNIQSQNCGKIGFDISCNENHQTILELPNSINFIINKIDYKSQKIHVTNPNGCLPKLLSNINISSTPFHFIDNSNSNYTLFNCSSMNTALQSHYSPIKCLSSHGYQVYALNSTLKIKDVTLTYCTKLYDMSFVPKDVVFSIGVDLVLGWDTSCSNGSKTEHDCYNIVNESNGIFFYKFLISTLYFKISNKCIFELLIVILHTLYFEHYLHVMVAYNCFSLVL
jgi:hypothetical protein